MQERKRLGLIKKAQYHTPMQEAAATAPDRTLPFMVMEALHTGKENAISAKELCDYLGFNSVRELQHEIARERKAGAVIISTCQEGGGYFLPGNDREVRQFIKTLENRANNTYEALRSAKGLLRQQEVTEDEQSPTGGRLHQNSK